MLWPLRGPLTSKEKGTHTASDIAFREPEPLILISGVGERIGQPECLGKNWANPVV